MSAITFGKTLSLKQATNLILAVPENVHCLVGEPGIGKSSVLGTLEAAGYMTAYIDVPNMDLGDIAMPIVNKETKQTEYAPSARFRLQEAAKAGKRVAIMLDEFSKGAQPVQNMLHPLLEAHNPRLGDIPLPKGSIVFLTGNLSTDSVGDSLKAHTLNRIVRVHVRKPNAEEWLEWAANTDKGIDPIVMAWVHQYPHAMASYLDDGQDNNLYIFNPRKPMTSYVSGRSLERASNTMKKRDMLDNEQLLSSLIGTIGEAAARDMQAFVEYQDKLPKWADIIANPDKAPVPDGAGATSVLVFGAVQRVDKQTIDPFMQYLSRLEAEWQACFVVNMGRSVQKQEVAFKSKAFADWVRVNEDIL